MKKIKSNNKIPYIIIIVLFIIAVFGITLDYLVINREYTGTIDVKTKYSDIIFNNIFIEENNNMSIKINEDEDYIHVDIDELEDNNVFYIDLVNIGNIDKKISTSIKNFNSNVDSNLIDINVINDDNTIKGSETKRIYVFTNYTKDKNIDIANLSFNINFEFE